MDMDIERDAILRGAMRAGGLGAMLAWHPEDLVMMAGAWPCLGMNLILYPADGAPVYYMSPNEPEDACPEGFALRRFAVEPGSWTDLRSLLAADLARLGLSGGRIGVAADAGQHAVTSFPGESPPFGPVAIARILEGAGAREADAVFVAAGLRKTAREVERIRLANGLACAGLEVFAAELKPGRSEAEVAAAVEAAIHSRSGQGGCRLARAWAHVQAGPGSALGGTYSRSSGYRLAEGDLVLIELATCVDGYWSDLTRTAAVGEPGVRQRELLRAVEGAQAAAIAAVRPGATHEAIDAAARDYLSARGYAEGFRHDCGHHVGFRYHDRGPTLRVGSATPLEEGMIITVEPGSYGRDFGGGCRIEDDVLVVAEGAKVLSARPS